MTRGTYYCYGFADGHKGPLRYYGGVPCGYIETGLPRTYWAPVDDRLAQTGGVFTRNRLRGWLDDLAPYEPPGSLLELVDFVDDAGSYFEPELTLRLFLEVVLRGMDAEGAVEVHISRD